ncbi:MAG: sodium/proline symporter PutP [Henriciella sp.]
MQNISALITLLAYSAVLFGVGLWAAQRAKSQEAFLLGGRNLGPIVAGVAYAASSSSAWVLLGFSGFVYVAGPSALWMVPGILGGYVAVWFGTGPVLQSSSAEKNHLTLTDFLTEDAGRKTARWIRIAASLMIAFCFAFYVASQFQGAGIAFDDLFGTGLATGVLIGAVIILGYTFLGGFMAVSLIDTLQGFLMAAVSILLPALAFFAAGGFSGLAETLSSAPDAYRDGFGDRTGFVAAGFVIGLVATGFGALGQPHLLAWIMATRSRKARVTGAGIAMGWACLVYLGMAVLGLSARALLGTEAAAEGVFFQLASDLLPSVFAGIIAAATLSAIMSTVDSQLLVVGGAISHDLGLAKAFGGRDVLVSRLAIVAVCIAAIVITLVLPATIFDRTLFAWSALGASFGPTVVARACGLRASGGYVLASILLGFGLSIGYEFFLDAGPGAVWSRTLPWVLAAVPLIIAAITRENVRPAIDAKE